LLVLYKETSKLSIVGYCYRHKQHHHRSEALNIQEDDKSSIGLLIQCSLCNIKCSCCGAMTFSYNLQALWTCFISSHGDDCIFTGNIRRCFHGIYTAIRSVHWRRKRFLSVDVSRIVYAVDCCACVWSDVRISTLNDDHH